MWYLYILESLPRKDKIYIGSTDNLERRLREHNRGHTASTRRFMPWRILYSEEYAAKDAARARERQLKSWKNRDRINALICRDEVIK